MSAIAIKEKKKSLSRGGFFCFVFFPALFLTQPNSTTHSLTQAPPSGNILQGTHTVRDTCGAAPGRWDVRFPRKAVRVQVEPAELGCEGVWEE